MREIGVYMKRLKIVRGDGIYLWDADGKRYIDAISGIGVAILGHNHKEFMESMCRQFGKLTVAGPMFSHEEMDMALDELSHFVKYEYAFFSNSGTEGVEAALKFARLYTKRKEIISMTNAFHGRTFGALSATWKKRYKEDYYPLVSEFKHIPFNDVESAKEAVTRNTAAVIVEPIQGEGGIIPAKKEFLKTLRDITDDKGALLIFDEVQSGLRTGKFLASEHYNVNGDIIVLGKGIGNGVPVGITLMDFDIPRGKHGSTFGGNPIATRAVAETLRILRRDNLIEKAEEKKLYLKSDKVVAIRGKGLMIGVVLREPAGRYIEKIQNMGVLVNAAGNRVIRLLPPLIINQDELNEIGRVMEAGLHDS